MNANPEGINALVAKWRYQASAMSIDADHTDACVAQTYQECADELESLTAVAGDAERKPDGYAYRYPHYNDGTVIRLNNGQEVNGCRPIEAIPYYFGTPTTRQAVEGMVPLGEVQALLELYSNDEASDEPQTEHDLGYEQACAEFVQHLSGLLAAAAPQAGKGDGNGND